MAKIRLNRTIETLPGSLPNLLKDIYVISEYIKNKIQIHTQIYCTRFGVKRVGTLQVFMDFDSLAQYESIYIEGLLKDKEYLKLLHAASKNLSVEPYDEILVLVQPDDFFMVNMSN